MLAVFVPAHTVGGEQIEIAVFGHGHGQRDRIVTEENSPDREGVFVVLADETFVADCLDFEFHFAALFGGCRYSAESRVPLFKRKVEGCYAEDVAALEYLLLDADAVDEGAVCRAAVFDLPAGSGFANSAVIT